MSNRKRGGGWESQSALTRVTIIVLALVGIAGTALICSGLYIKAKARLSQYLLQQSFAARLAGDTDARPWPWADFTVAARISVPRLNISEIVLEGATGQTLAFGPALVNGTPEPGAPGTSVIAAHRDTHFAWLKDLQVGDLINVETPDGIDRTFRVNGSRVADWENNGINAAAFGTHLALATCWPFDAKTRGPLRYILDAELIDDPVNIASSE
ncbi:class GN sortase [Rhizobium sp. L1K21]|uniref:class GN sortase n=1 Tax=Rhizobium sp. L1K21 TaxID=2954933 RepID=UPI00209320E2|nr:class GN sortase [Rhizobium sp. L1K21]MCO6185490.1 class GN sortase [Rhizobium sp. L1K21]